METIALPRALDANLNRVTEGLRVVEDIVRYGLDDGSLQERIKSLRHRLTADISKEALVMSRRPLEDVGFNSKGDLEYSRKDIRMVLRANCKRSQEGLRSLEELFKLTDAEAAGRMKALRYEIYELERCLWVRMDRRTLRKGLYLVLTEPRDGYEKLTELAVQAELPAVQLRYKGTDVRKCLDLARAMRRITAGTDTLFIVNDRPDIALMAEADGVHVGREDLPVSAVRRLIGPEMLLGLSTHTLDEVRAAGDEPVDYIGFGPLYATNSKEKPDPVVGPQGLPAAFNLSRHPIVAIGGITRDRISEIDLGCCHNVAVITAVTHADDPLAVMTALNRKFQEAP